MDAIREWAAFLLLAGIATAHVFRWVGRHDQREADADRQEAPAALAVRLKHLEDAVERLQSPRWVDDAQAQLATLKLDQRREIDLMRKQIDRLELKVFNGP